jgi:hypothetical protein
MSTPEQMKTPDENVLMRNVDLARQRLLRRGGELELVLSERSISRKERSRRLSYAMSGIEAAHAELRDAVIDLAAFEDTHPDPA